MYAMSTLAKKYHHGDLRRVLLEEGCTLLAETGADGLSMRELARRAGVSAMAPYRHYPDRDSLLAAIAASGFLRLASRVEAIGVTAEPDRTSLLRAGIAYVMFALEQPALFRLMFGGDRPDAQYADLSVARSGAFNALMRHIQAEPGSGQRITYAQGCWSLVHGLALLLLDGVLQPPEGLDLEPWLAQVIRGMITAE